MTVETCASASAISEGALKERIAAALDELVSMEAAYRPTTIGKLLKCRAQTHGSTIAIDIFERGERVSYEELDRLSDRCARALQRLGVAKGDRVAVMLPNRIEFPIVWFAIVKIGAVIVSLNTGYTPREISYVLNDVGARCAIIDQSVWRTFHEMDPWPQEMPTECVICIGDPQEKATTLTALMAEADDRLIEVDVQPNDLANIQYTSGTTGFPKGCMLTHDHWMRLGYAYSFADREIYRTFLNWSPLFYTFGYWLLVKALHQGGTLYVAQKLSSSRFMDWIGEFRTEWVALPSMLANITYTAPDCLKQVSQYDGWDAVTVRRLREDLGIRAKNSYGMTETGLALQMPAFIDEIDESETMGTRGMFCEIRLAADDGRSVPIGDVGEMWIRGRGLFKGYWRRPEANAECFEGDWFKTGDLFRENELGCFALVGRKKDVVRRSGENIAAREVEAVLNQLPEVAEIAVVPVPDIRRGEEVMAYVELRQGFRPEDVLEVIFSHARTHLAAFKVPRYVAFIDELPRTSSSNKVVKRELGKSESPLQGAYDYQERRWC